MTDCGMNFMSLAMPRTPSTICKMPARITVANRYWIPWDANWCDHEGGSGGGCGNSRASAEKEIDMAMMPAA